ncbi:MAG: exosortase A [Thiohalorhabdus sp.]|uniref:exosortase A n=1 Tax=Thiohalorhabdus sp. TaxID=3094134 RepID=UPI00398163C1
MRVPAPEGLQSTQGAGSRAEVRPLLLALLLLAGLVGLYHETALSMAAIWWRSETYAHGMLVVPVSAFLLWRRRRALARLPLEPDLKGVLALALLAGIWLVARQAEVLFLQHLTFVAMVPAGLWALLGARFLRTAAFPLGFLLFAVPLGEGLVPILQDFTADFSVAGLQLSGVPVYREGHYLSIPEGRFEVAEACSGIRYLIASLAIGTLFAYLNYRSPWRRLAFVVAAAAVPVLANGLRAYGIVMLARWSDMALATGVDHLIYGWVFFGVVMVLLFWVGGLWRDAESRFPEAPNRQAPEDGGRGTMTLALSGLAVLAVAGAGPAGAGWLDRSGAPIRATSLDLPAAEDPWNGPFPVEDSWRPDFRGADRALRRVYRSPEGNVHVLLIHFYDQRQGEELIASGNHLHDGKRWLRSGEGRARLDLPEQGGELGVRELRLRGPGDRRLVWHWYNVGGHLTAHPVMGKIWMAWERVRGGRPDATLIAVASDYDGEPEVARERVADFLAKHPGLTRDGRVVRVLTEEGR